MSKCIFLFKYKDLDVPKEAVNHLKSSAESSYSKRSHLLTMPPKLGRGKIVDPPLHRTGGGVGSQAND